MRQVLCLLLWCFSFSTFQADCADHVELGFDYSIQNSAPFLHNWTKQRLLVARLRDSGVTRVKLFTSDAVEVAEFVEMWGPSELKLMLALLNPEMIKLARGSTTFDAERLWLLTSTVSMFKDKIEYLALGNEVDFPAANNYDYFASLVPALETVYSELQRLNISHVKLTSPLSGASCRGSGYANLDVQKSYFADSYDSVIGCNFDWCKNHQQVPVRKYLVPLLDFLNRTNAPFVMNIYPFFQYRATLWPLCQLTNSCFNMSLEFATGVPGADPLVDVVSGIKYRSLLEMTIDGTRVSMAKLGYGNVPLILGETGWPSQGSPELGTTVRNSCMYMRSVVSVINSGTPSAPGVSVGAYYFAWVDEVNKWDWSGRTADPGVMENHWGVLSADMEQKFPLDFVPGGADCSSILESPKESPHPQQLLDRAPSAGSLPCAVAGVASIVFVTFLAFRHRSSAATLDCRDSEGQYAVLG